MTSQGKANALVASIQVRLGNESLGVHKMHDGTSLIIGNDENCGLTLEHEAIAAKHCVLRMADGDLFINDWYSESGTFVNGEKIYAETQLDLRDQVVLGPFELRFDVTSAMQIDSASFDHTFGSSSPENIEDGTDAVAHANDHLDQVQKMVEEVRSETPANSVRAEESPSSLLDPLKGEPEQADQPVVSGQLAAANAEIEALKRELEYQLSLNSFAEVNAKADELDPMNADESELMRAEIEHLQRELQTREEEIQQLLSNGNGAGEALVDSEETERLVSRLEQLLEELDESDRRAKSLETMLQASDEATEAEREERRQLETWVSEVEDRIITRQQQWEASEEKLSQRLSEAEQLCHKLSSNLQNAARGKSTEMERATQSMITDLTEKNKVLGDHLQTATTELERMKQLVEDSNISEDDLASMKEQMEAMRRHEVEMAQERAQMARNKAELVRLREELEAAQNAVGNAGAENPDVKVRAFRQHLKDIHEQEQNARQRGLASRISQLWNRLDNR